MSRLHQTAPSRNLKAAGALPRPSPPPAPAEGRCHCLYLTTRLPFGPALFYCSFQALRLSSIFLRTVFQASLVRKESRQRFTMRSNIS